MVNKKTRQTSLQKIALVLLPVLGVLALKTFSLARVYATHSSGNSDAAMVKSDREQKEIMTEMKHYLAEATEASKSGDFEKAKEEYDEFHNKWKSVEEEFKNKSKEKYERIEGGMEAVKTNLLNVSTPDQDKAIASFEKLSQALDAYSSGKTN